MATTNAQWRLVDPFGDQVVTANIGTDIDTTVLTNTGIYTLLLEGRRTQGTPNAYQFNVQKVVDDTSVLAFGEVTNGSIGHAGQQDFYTFSLGQRSRLYLDSLVNSAINWTLTGPGGVIVDPRSLSSTDANAVSANPVLDLVAGNYTLKFDATGDATGNYSFRMLDLATASTLIPQPAGSAPVTGTLDPGSQTRIYGLDVNAGDRFFFDRQSQGPGTVYWRLIDPYGGQLFWSNFTTDVGNLTLTSGGRYTLADRRRAEQLGSHELRLQRRTAWQPGNRIDERLRRRVRRNVEWQLATGNAARWPDVSRHADLSVRDPRRRAGAAPAEHAQQRQRLGFGSTSVIPAASSFRYELRFNTLTQSFATGAEGLLEFWLVDEADPAGSSRPRYTAVPMGSTGGCTPTRRKAAAS